MDARAHHSSRRTQKVIEMVVRTGVARKRAWLSHSTSVLSFCLSSMARCIRSLMLLESEAPAFFAATRDLTSKVITSSVPAWSLNSLLR